MKITRAILILTLSLFISQSASAECTSFIADGYHQSSQARISMNCTNTQGIVGSAGSIHILAPSLQRVWIRIGKNFDRIHTPQVVGYVLEEVITLELIPSTNGLFSLDLSTIELDPNDHYFFEAATISNFLGFTFYNVISDPGTFRFR